MDDFDIEKYLDEQVTSSKSKENDKKINDDAVIESSRKDEDSKRSLDRDRERDRKGRDRDRDVSRDRGRDDRRDGSRDRHRRRRSRSRSDSRHRRRRSRSRSNDRRRSRDRHSRRDKERESDRDKEKPPKDIAPVSKPVPTEEDIIKEKQRLLEKEQKRIEEEQEKEMLRRQQEIDDLTRDQRTIFVGQLTMKVTEKNLRDFFDQISKVKNIIMIRDKNTGKHKGFAYVEITDLDQIPNCLLFNNVVPDFQKFPILVKQSEAEKNYLARKDTGFNGPDSRIYIGNIHVNINEDALRTVLEQFGPLDTVLIQRDEMGNSKGFAFAKFRLPESATLAMNGLAGMELVGRPLKVGPVLDNGSKVSTGSTSTSGQSVNWKLDDDDGSKGMYLNSQSRMMLMAKLGEGAGIHVPAPVQQTGQATVPQTPPITGLASRAFVIANMFDPHTETEPNWDQDIRDDVTEECSKFGNVENCYVEKTKPGGLVFVKFSSIESSVKAAQSLNGRFFAGKMITVTYLDPLHYDKIIYG